MTISESILAAIIQGITEFLPVSSSGHVTILTGLLGYKTPGITYQIYLHLGSLAAVILVFRNDIIQLFRPSGRNELRFVLIGSVPVLAAGLFFRENVGPIFGNIKLVGCFLIANGIWLLVAHLKEKSGSVARELTKPRSFLVGIAQIFALLPGISRSGATIGSALLLGIKRIDAYRFSFLLFIPVVFSALIYDLKEFSTLINIGAGPLIAGLIATFLVSIVALKLLRFVLLKSKLYIFGIYCMLIGFLTIILP